MEKRLEIFIDGASRGNPGKAAVGVVIKHNGNVIKEISQAIGIATNNVAEYTALLYALDEAAELKAHQLSIFSDSELLCKQVTGKYKIKNDRLRSLFDQAQQKAASFENIAITHIPREKNKDADALASHAITKGQAKVVASRFTLGEESPSSAG